MSALARTYFEPDCTEGRPVYSKAGIGPSQNALRVEHVVSEAVKLLGTPFDDRSHLPVRRYIARMKLSPAQLARLVGGLSNVAAGRYALIEQDLHAKLGDYLYRAALFYTCRAAMSLLVETAPRSRLDLEDLTPLLMNWPSVLPPAMQAHVASVLSAHVADTITGRPFKRRSLVPRGGAR